MVVNASASAVHGARTAPLDAAVWMPQLHQPSPFTLIPVEIVLHIFSFHALREELSGIDDQPLSTCTVFSITQVCRRWRQIALDFPRLWNRVLLYNTSVTTELLARSQSAPIVVHASSLLRTNGLPSKLESLTLVLQDPRRLQELVIRGIQGENYLNPLKTIPAPLLEVLHLFSYTSRHNGNGDNIPLSMANTPTLRSLSLTSSAVDQDWFRSLSNLTSLELRKHGLPLGVIMEVLSKSPHLTYFRIYFEQDEDEDEEVGGHPGSASIPEQPSIELPHLEQLCVMEVNTAHFAALLAHIQIPINTRLCATLLFEPQERIDDLVMASLIHYLAPPGAAQRSGPHWRTLCVRDYMEGGDFRGATFFANPEETKGFPDNGWKDNAFLLDMEILDFDIVAFLEFMLSQPLLSAVDTVVLQTTVFLPLSEPDSLRFLFNPSLHIKTLVLFGYTFVVHCEAIKWEEEPPEYALAHWEVFRLLHRMPYLERLVLNRCHVKRRWARDARPPSARTANEQCERLRLADSQAQRAFAVEIVDCDVDEALVQKLWRAAGSVGKWDAGWDKKPSHRRT
ncbi:hypothetical protein BV25DRAFT_1833353 [Artomyces pyxidatus]|uniref:Uncharacterized protein n=1 Tax=Artomyces pyxidatus TaxID=48021 RepID=A0ACB8SF37_9AGAM|nr:hypothetical protein BV25DRAFT_1833353 [Artomyces pyxidatus]